VREAEVQLVATRECARFGKDDEYTVGSRETVFEVLTNFAKDIKEDTRCELVARKCKMYSLDAGAWEDCNKRGLIPKEPNLVPCCRI